MSKAFFKGLGSLKQTPVYSTAPTKQELLAPKKEAVKVRLSFLQAEALLATGTTTTELRQQLLAEYPEWGKAQEIKEKMGAIAPPDSVLSSDGTVLSVRELTNKSTQLSEVAALAVAQLNSATTAAAAAIAATKLRKAREERADIATWLKTNGEYYSLEKALHNLTSGDGYKVAEKISRLCDSYDDSLVVLEFDDAAIEARIAELKETEEAAAKKQAEEEAKQAEEEAKQAAANAAAAAAANITNTPILLVNGVPVEGKSVTINAGTTVGFQSPKPLTYSWSGPKGFASKTSIQVFNTTGTYKCNAGGITFTIKVVAPK